MHKFTKKRIALGGLGLLIMVAAALAYFASEGEGEGEATVGSTTDNIVVKSTTTGELYPLASEPAANTKIKVENPGSGVVKVKEVTAGEITVDTPHAEAGCEASWFKFGGSPISINQSVSPGGSYETPSAVGKLWLENKNEDQSACKGATVTVAYTSN
jgi:hypothetical protein